MSENNTSKSKHYVLSALVIFLIAFAGVQTWYMVNMKQKLDTISAADKTTINSTDVAQATPPSIVQVPPVALQNTVPKQSQPDPKKPADIFNDDFFNQPFASRDWNPGEMIARMQREMDQMFNTNFSQLNNASSRVSMFDDGLAAPQMNMKEDHSKYIVTMQLPGAKENNISVNLDGQQLMISGEQDFDQQKKDGQGNVIFQQHRTGQFQRSVTLPEPVKPGSLVSHVDNGVLTVTVSKMS